jgi:hypothetical protein
MSGDDPIKAGSGAGSAPPYTPAGGPRLAQFLDALPVKTRWIHNHRLVWQTGQQNAPDGPGLTPETHCSAFIAAVALMLDIYILRPPHHGQNDLANAQADWLAGTGAFPGPTASGSKWVVLGSSGDAGALKAAVEAANAGQLVVAIYKAPQVQGADDHGHAVIVRPQDAAAVGADGPHVASVADCNRPDTPMQKAFHAHPGAWPSKIALYAHATDLEKDST